MLQRQIDEISGGNMTVFGSSPAVSSPVSELRRSSPRPVTFTTTIFGQQETESRPISTQSLPQTPIETVNPASLSPDLRPVAESSNANSSDLTQHPAVSVGGASALDGFNLNYGFPDFGNDVTGNFEYGSLLDHSHPSDADHQFLENHLPTISDDFYSQLDNMAHNNTSATDYNFDEFINNDDQLAPEIQSSDIFAETTTGLQPQLGASS